MNGRRVYKFLNPFSFSAERINANHSQNQNASNDSHEGNNFRKFTKQTRKSSIIINDIFLNQNKQLKHSERDYCHSKIRFNYENLMKGHHQTNQSEPIHFFHNKIKGSQNNSNNNSNSNSNINSNNNINNKLNFHKFHLDKKIFKLPKQNSFKGRTILSPLSSDSKRGISLKKQMQKKKNDYLKLFTHLKKERTTNAVTRLLSPSYCSKKLDPPKNNNVPIKRIEENNESFMNELDDLIKNINVKGDIGLLESEVQNNKPFSTIEIEPMIPINNNALEEYRRSTCQTPNERPQTSYGGMKLRKIKMNCISKESKEITRRNDENDEQYIEEKN